MSEPPVQRKFRRIPFDGEVRVYTGSAMAGTRLIDISLKGALVDRPPGWEAKAGQIQRLELRVGSGVIISVGTTVAHVDEGEIGYRFERMDLDSFARLKRLIELNLGDPELLNRELAALGS